MKKKQSILKNNIFRIVLVILAALSCIFMFFVTLQQTAKVEESFAYSNDIIKQTEKNDEALKLDDLVNKDAMTGYYPVGNGYTIEQDFNSGSVSKVIAFRMYVDTTDLDPNGLNIKIIKGNPDDAVEYEATAQIYDDSSIIITPTDFIVNGNKSDYTLRITNNTGKDFHFLCFGKDNGSILNGDKVDSMLEVSYLGQTAFIDFSIIVLFTIVLIISLVLLVFSFVYDREFFKEDKLKLGVKFVIEFIMALASCLLLFLWFVEYTYSLRLNIIIYFAFIAFAIATFIYILKLIQNNIDNYAIIFVAICIPLGLLYWTFVLQEFVPDEGVHYAKAFLTSQFKITNNTAVDLPNDINRQSFGYRDILNSLLEHTDYSDTYTTNSAASYNAIMYVIPGFFIMVVRLLGLSIRLGFALGRLSNFVLFLFIGYQTVKTTPIAKLLFVVYLMLPMNMQQSISLSSDVMVHAVNLFAIAYILKLRFSEDAISWKDIYILCGCFFLTMITKINYAPIYIFVFINYKKIFKMDLKKAMFIGFTITFSLIFYFCYTTMLPTGSTLSSQVKFLTESGVNSGKQTNLLKENKKYAVDVIMNTFNYYGFSYLYELLGHKLAKISVEMPYTLSNIYLFILILSVYVREDKYRLKIIEKILAIILCIIMSCAIIIALYIAWTVVGGPRAEGVQGRYFIPFFILIPLCLCGKFRLKIKSINWIIIVTAFAVNMISIGYLINYFV